MTHHALTVAALAARPRALTAANPTRGSSRAAPLPPNRPVASAKPRRPHHTTPANRMMLATSSRWGRSGSRSWLCSQKCQAATPRLGDRPDQHDRVASAPGPSRQRRGPRRQQNQRAHPHHGMGLQLVGGGLELLVGGVPDGVHDPPGDEHGGPECHEQTR